MSCSHNNIQQHNCTHCGVYLSPEQNISALKTNSAPHLELFDCSRYFKAMIRKVGKIEPRQSGLPTAAVLDLIDVLVDRFRLNRQTHALAIFIYDSVAGRKKMTSARQQLFVGASVLIASKFSGKQSLVPRLSRIGRILGVADDCNKDQLARIEREIFQAVGYQLEITSYIDLVEFYLFNGVVFSNQNSINLPDFQSKILKEVDSYLKCSKFLKYKQGDLAAYIIHKIRKEFFQRSAWNQHLEKITHITKEKIEDIVREVQFVENPSPLTIKRSIVNIRYEHVPSFQKKHEAECSLRKLQCRDNRILRAESSRYRLHSIKSYDRLNISSFRID